ncbi:MAG TPA: tetratricopeptide repeat protein [Pyrinomonadaceae bacterium]|nr:tetratricopeptide repeat protein [Pyrinomonadaceae bacterium]
MKRLTVSLAASAASLLLGAALASAQSGATRPRRVTPVQPTTDASNAATTTTTTGRASEPAETSAPPAAAGSTAHAFSLFQQKRYDAALQEAKQIAAADPKNSEAWKLAGFAEIGLKRFPDAAEDLRRARDLQSADSKPDPHTDDALAEAYFFAGNYEQALPLLVAETTRKDAKPDATTLSYRGVAEMNLKKTEDAARTFNEVLKADPKNRLALLYLGQMAFARNDYTTAVNLLNRATLADPSYAQAWELLTQAYLFRGRSAQGAAADADFLAAVRAGDSLARLRNDEQTAALQGQALFFAKQYERAAAALERAAASPKAQDATFFLLGYAYFQTKNYPKAITALERASEKTPDNADIYRLLGFSYETTKQYVKALSAYEKGQQLVPTDAYFKESADRVRPFAKQ